MPKSKITDYDATAANNTDVGGVSIAEGCNFGNMNNAIRELMSHLAEVNAGTYPLKDTFSIADPADLTKIARFDCGSITTSTTRVVTIPDKSFTLIAADSPTFTDTSDATKTITFDISGVTTGTDRAIAWPDLAGTVVLSSTVITDAIAGVIETPDNQSYTLFIKAPFAGTITETTTKSASGTATATFKINTTALGGTANSVSSSEQSQLHASANAFSAGDDIVLTISSNSACLDLSFTIKFTRTVA